MRDACGIPKTKRAGRADRAFGSFLHLSGIMLVLMLTISSAAVLLANPVRDEAARGWLGSAAVVLAYASLTGMALLAFITAFIYKTGRVPCVMRIFAAPAKGLLLPLLLFISGFLGSHRNRIRIFCVIINNIIVSSLKKRYRPDKTLLLLPHCLQRSQCPNKLTGGIGNCSMCMKCDIGAIRKLAENCRIGTVEIVAGGTAARQAVQKSMPEFIIAVACETDLTSGISDVGGIPVYGIINERPEGPCVNTRIHVEELEDAIRNFLIQGNATELSIPDDARGRHRFSDEGASS